MAMMMLTSSLVDGNNTYNVEELVGTTPKSRYAPLRSRPENYTSVLTMYGSHRVEESMQRLPDWLQKYFAWHAEQRRNESDDTKFLVIGCFLGERCGGTSDRLRGLLYYLLIAHLSERVLVIKWNKPHDLSEYLMPAGNVDWRAPVEVDGLIRKRTAMNMQHELKPFFGGYCMPKAYGTIRDCVQYITRTMKESDHKYHALGMFTKGFDTINIVNSFAQAYGYKNEMPGLSQWKYPDMFGDIFRVMFEPVPKLAQQINSTMVSLGLVENEYVSVHVRARYPVPRINKFNKNWDKNGGFEFNHNGVKGYLLSLAKNAMNCSKALEDNYPVFFASDSNEYTNFVVNTTAWLYEDRKMDLSNMSVRGIQRLEEPPHLDRDDGWPGSDPTYFYSVFEDLLILGGSRCVSHGIGSFGSFGAGLIGNKCRSIHRKYNGIPVSCPNDRTDNYFVRTDNIEFDKHYSWNGKKPPFPRLTCNISSMKCNVARK